MSGVCSCSVPATPIALEHRLVRPEASQVHCRLQLGFAKADHLRSVASHKFVDHLLFRLGVETSDIEGKEFELFPVSSHFRESAIDVVSLTVRSCIRQVLSFVVLTPSRSLCLLFGSFLCHLWLLLRLLSLLLGCSQYQLDHATFRSCLGAYCHYMIDSSLTTPLPHLKSLYYTHMGGLAMSGSHGVLRVPL